MVKNFLSYLTFLSGETNDNNLSEKYGSAKIGFGIETKDSDKMYQYDDYIKYKDYKTIADWESQFWDSYYKMNMYRM